MTPEELSAAALQFVRKISGYNRPSKANEQAFQAAVIEIAAASQTGQAACAPRNEGNDLNLPGS